MAEITLMRDPTYALAPEEMVDEIADFIAKFFRKVRDLEIVETETLLATTLGAIAGATSGDPAHKADAAKARQLLINCLRCMEAEAGSTPVGGTVHLLSRGVTPPKKAAERVTCTRPAALVQARRRATD